MHPGQLDRTITIQTFTVAQDATGQPIQTWSTLAIVRASVLEVNARERFQALREVGVFSAVFTIRWLSGLNDRNRVIYDGKTYDIVGIQEQGRRQWLALSGEVIE